MTNPTEIPNDLPSLREQQLTTVQALAALLEMDLPQLIWTTHPHLRLDLTGTVPGVGGRDPREAVPQWAAVLKAEVVEQSEPDQERITISATARYRHGEQDVTVTVRGHIYDWEANH